MGGEFHLRRCLIALILALLVSACARGDGQGALFQDSFDNPRSGWGQDQRQEFERGYENGEYFIELGTPNWFAWAHPGKRLSNVSVGTDAYLASGAPDGNFGVLCRYVDDDNFYYFAISADGYYAIFSRMDGEMRILTGDGSGMLPASAIKTDGEVNHIVAVCREDELSLSVNGQLLSTVTNEDHAQGDVGLGAGSGPAGNTLVKFDDFSATVP
jgi:hypothetical protein